MRSQIRRSRTPHSTLLLRPHGAARTAVAAPRALLHFDEAEDAASSYDQIELVAARAYVRAEHAPTAQPVPPRSAALTPIQTTGSVAYASALNDRRCTGDGPRSRTIFVCDGTM